MSKSFNAIEATDRWKQSKIASNSFMFLDTPGRSVDISFEHGDMFPGLKVDHGHLCNGN